MSALPWPRALWLLARLYLRQVLRSKAVWFAGLIIALPALVGFAVAQEEPEGAWNAIMGMVFTLLAFVPAALSARVIAEELDRQTFTYLWSRPIRRWTVLVGKGLGATGATGALLLASAGIGYLAAESRGLVGHSELIGALGATAVGCLSLCAISASIGTMLPRHPVASAIVYMLVLDLPVGAIPFGLRYLSVTFHLGELAGVGDAGVNPAVSLMWIAGITAAWIAVGLWRLGKAEGLVKS